tara:strand:+ start:48067 stop:48366 length:300 start_codon:yes stop_codon:yes gene_type:complete
MKNNDFRDHGDVLLLGLLREIRGGKRRSAMRRQRDYVQQALIFSATVHYVELLYRGAVDEPLPKLTQATIDRLHTKYLVVARVYALAELQASPEARCSI